MADAKSMTGSVKVKQNRYSVKGTFHVIDPNKPIYNEKNKLCGVTNPRSMTYIHSYGKEYAFFEGISKGILRGTRCMNPKCAFKGSTYLPFRIFCPDCLEEMKVVDLTSVARKTAKIHTFMITERTGAFNTLEKPIKFINVEIEGVSVMLMSYIQCGDPEIGLSVVPIFRTKNPTFTITDLSWVLKGTPASKLPKGFTF